MQVSHVITPIINVHYHLDMNGIPCFTFSICAVGHFTATFFTRIWKLYISLLSEKDGVHIWWFFNHSSNENGELYVHIIRKPFSPANNFIQWSWIELTMEHHSCQSDMTSVSQYQQTLWPDMAKNRNVSCILRHYILWKVTSTRRTLRNVTGWHIILVYLSSTE